MKHNPDSPSSLLLHFFFWIIWHQGYSAHFWFKWSKHCWWQGIPENKNFHLIACKWMLYCQCELLQLPSLLQFPRTPLNWFPPHLITQILQEPYSLIDPYLVSSQHSQQLRQERPVWSLCLSYPPFLTQCFTSSSWTTSLSWLPSTFQKLHHTFLTNHSYHTEAFFPTSTQFSCLLPDLPV